jgi:hypothetical protein
MRTVWSRRRWWTVLGLTAVLFTAVAWYFWGRPTSLKFPDGRVVTVRAVTWGTNHVYVEGSLLARLVWVFRSPAAAYRLGYFRFERSTPLPTCLLWTSWSLPPGTDLAQKAYVVSVADVNGMETEPAGAYLVQGSRGRHTVVAWPLENFPRSQRRIKLRFHVRDANYHPECVGELFMSRPRIPRPTEHAARPALTVVQDGVEFSLLSVARVPPSREAQMRSFFVAPWNRVEFSVRENGRPALSSSNGPALSSSNGRALSPPNGRALSLSNGSWTLHDLRATGVSGNRALEWGSLVVRRAGDRITAWCAGAFWPEEAGWTFDAEFERIADFAPGELFTLPPVFVPGGKLPVLTNLEVEAHDVLVKSIKISGPTRMRSFQRGGYRPNAEVKLVFSPQAGQLSVSLAGVTDDQGRPVPLGHELQLGKSEYEAGLELPADLRSLQLELAVRRRRLVRFTTGPGFVRPLPSAIAPRGADGQTPTP